MTISYVKSFAIVGYTYAADTYCWGECVIQALLTGDGERFDGWALAAGADPMSTEDNLTEIAMAFGIDRMDEYSFDSDEFPKVIFADSVDSDEVCAGCGGPLL